MLRAIIIVIAVITVLCAPSDGPALGQESMSFNFEKIDPKAPKPGQPAVAARPRQKKGGMLVPAVQKVRDSAGRSKSKGTTKTTPLLPKALSKN